MPKDPPKEFTKEPPKEFPKDITKEPPKEFPKDPPKELAKEPPLDPPKSVFEPPKGVLEPPFEPPFPPVQPVQPTQPFGPQPFVLATGMEAARAAQTQALAAYAHLLGQYLQLYQRGMLDAQGYAAWRKAWEMYRQLGGM